MDITNSQRIKTQTEIRRIQEERAYNEKVAALLKEEKREKIERKKTDNVLLFAFRNAILIAGVLIFWDIFRNGLRWSF